MALSILYWANYVEGLTKIKRKSEAAVESQKFLRFAFDELRVITANVQASMRDTSYKVQLRCFFFCFFFDFFLFAFFKIQTYKNFMNIMSIFLIFLNHFLFIPLSFTHSFKNKSKRTWGCIFKIDRKRKKKQRKKICSNSIDIKFHFCMV